MAKREWKLSVGIDTVLEKDSLKKVEKKLDELEKPIKPKLDLSDAEKKLDKIEKRLGDFENEKNRLESKLSNAMSKKDKEEIKSTVKELEKVEEQISRNRKEQQGLNSDLRAYKEEKKAERGKNRKLSEDEKKADKLIERSKTPRPKKPKTSDSGDAAAVKAETKANQELEQSIENVDKARRKSRAAKPKKSEAAEIKKEAKAYMDAAKASSEYALSQEEIKHARNVKSKYTGSSLKNKTDFQNAIKYEWGRGNKTVAAKLFDSYKQRFKDGKFNPANDSSFGKDWSNNYNKYLEQANRHIAEIEMRLIQSASDTTKVTTSEFKKFGDVFSESKRKLLKGVDLDQSKFYNIGKYDFTDEDISAAEAQIDAARKKAEELKDEALAAKELFDETKNIRSQYNNKFHKKIDLQNAIKEAWASGNKPVAAKLYDQYKAVFPDGKFDPSTQKMFGSDWVNNHEKYLEQANRHIIELDTILDGMAENYAKYEAYFDLDNFVKNKTKMLDEMKQNKLVGEVVHKDLSERKDAAKNKYSTDDAAIAQENLNKAIDEYNKKQQVANDLLEVRNKAIEAIQDGANKEDRSNYHLFDGYENPAKAIHAYSSKYSDAVDAAELFAVTDLKEAVRVAKELGIEVDKIYDDASQQEAKVLKDRLMRQKKFAEDNEKAGTPEKSQQMWDAYTEKKIEENKELAESYEKVGEAGQAAGEKEQKRAKLSKRQKFTNRYNNLMYDLGYDEYTIGTSDSVGTEKWGIDDMLETAQMLLSTYYESGHANAESKEELGYKHWASQVGKLKRFITACEKYTDEDMEKDEITALLSEVDKLPNPSDVKSKKDVDEVHQYISDFIKKIGDDKLKAHNSDAYERLVSVRDAYAARSESFNESIEQQTDALKENTQAAKENVDAQIPAQRATNDPMAARNKANEEAIRQQNELEEGIKRLNELSQDPWDIKSEEEVNRICRERLDIFSKLDEKKFREYNEDEYFGALSLNESYQNRLTGFAETRDDQIYNEIDEKYSYDNQILYSAEELEKMLENRKRLMDDISLKQYDSYREEQEINDVITKRLELMKELEPLVNNGSISKNDLEDIVFERGTLDERRSMLEGIHQNLFNLDDGELDEAQMVLDQYEKILVMTASGKKLELGPEMSEADYKAFMKADPEKVKSVEFVRKAALATEAQVEVLEDYVANDEEIVSQTYALEANTSAAKENSNETKTTIDLLNQLGEVQTRPLHYLLQNVIKDGSNIKEEVREVLQHLQLLDESGKFIGKYNEQGYANKGFFANNQHAVLVRDLEEYSNHDDKELYDYNFSHGTYLENLIQKMQEAKDQGVNLARILDVIESKSTSAGKFLYEIQELAPGQQVHMLGRDKTLEGFENECARIVQASDEQILKLINDIIQLNDMGFKFDFGVGNILYDTEKGFTLIDLALREVSDTIPTTEQLMRRLFSCLAGFSENDYRLSERFKEFGSEENTKWILAMESVVNRLNTALEASGINIGDSNIAEVFTNEFKTYFDTVNKGKKSLEEFLALYRELSDKSENKEAFGQRYAYLLEGVSGQTPKMDISAAYDELIQKEKEYQEEQEKRTRRSAEIAQETVRFTQAMNKFTPESGWLPELEETKNYVKFLELVSNGIWTAAEALEEYKRTVKSTEEAQAKINDKQKEYYEMSHQEATDYIKAHYDPDLWRQWFTQSRDNARVEIAKRLENDFELRNASLNNMWHAYKEDMNTDISFDDFLNSKIPVYRGEVMPFSRDGDSVKTLEKKEIEIEFASFSFNKEVAKSFAGGICAEGGAVMELLVSPTDTLGMPVPFGQDGEREFFIPTSYFSSSQEYLGLNKKLQEKAKMHLSGESKEHVDKLITSYEELCQVVARYNELVKKDIYRTTDEDLEFESLYHAIHNTVQNLPFDAMEERMAAMNQYGEYNVNKLAKLFGFDSIPSTTQTQESFNDELDELRTKADALGDEFKNSQQYKDFFAAIESGSIDAANATRKLEQAFDDFNVDRIGDGDKDGQQSLIPDEIDENEFNKLTKGAGIESFLRGLNISKDKIEEIKKELVNIFNAELGGSDSTEALNKLVQKMLELGSETQETHNIYEKFYEDFKNKKILFDDEMQAQFDPEDWAYIRRHNPNNLVHAKDALKYPEAMSIDSWLTQLRSYGLEAFDGIDDDKTLFKVFFEELAKARTASKQKKREKYNLSDLYDSSEREDYIYAGIADIFGKMYLNTQRSQQAIDVETGALKELEVQAENAAGAKKKVTKANKDLGAESVSSKDKVGAETDALEDLEEQANKVWTTPRKGGSIDGLNLPTQFVGEDGQSVVQMFADIKNEIEEATGSPVKIDFVSEVNKDGELEAVGATLEYVNKESGVTIKQFYDIAKGEDDVITATQTAEKATIKATKAQKEFNAELKKQLALEQINTLKKQMGEFPVDLTAAYAAANKIVDKESFDEFNLQLKIAHESLKGMKAEMKGQNTLDPIVAAEKRLKSLGSELDSLKNKFVLISGTGIDTNWIDGKISSIMDLYNKFNNETDADKKTGHYKHIIEELDKAENGMTNLNELIRIQNKLFKDRKALSKMDKDTQSYKIAEENVRLQGEELSNLIRNSEHRETIMKRAIQFENELAAAIQDRNNKQTRKFDARYSGSTLLDTGDWDGVTDQQQAMQKFAESALDGEFTIKGFNKAGTEMYGVLNKNDGALQQITVALDKSSKKIKVFETGSNGIADAFKQLGTGAMSYVKQLAGMYLGMNDFIRYAQQGIQHVRDIDLAMTELKKVTDATEASYAKFLDTAATSAGSIGSTVKDFTTVASDFARLGYSIEEASELAKTALIYENVGDGFNSVEEASESIISTMKAFGIEAEGTMGIVDRFNAVGNNFAITSKGIGDALQRSASALVEGGNSIDEAIGIITAANSVIQNPEQVGTAMKTLSLRLRSTKVELEEMGEDAEGAATSTAKLRAQLLGLTSGKVDIMADDTTFKNTTQILREMSAVWNDMDDISRAGALELMGGKRQANILSSIITNFKIVEEAIETSVNSAGSALAENAKYMESIQGHIDVLTNSWQAMWNNALSSDMLKFWIDFANILVQIVDKVGLLQVAFGALAGAIVFKSFGDSENIGIFATLLKKIPVVNALLSSFNSKLITIGLTEKAAASATGLFGSALTGLAGVGITLAIPVLMKIADWAITTSEEVQEAAMEAQETINTISSELKETESIVSDSAKRFAELAQGVDMLNGKNVSLTTDEYEEFLDLSNQLADIFPTLSRIYDENGNAIVQLSGDADTMVASLQNLLDAQRQIANQQIAEELPALYEGVYANSKEYSNQLKESIDERDSIAKRVEHISAIMNDGFNWSDGNIFTIEDNEIVQLYKDAAKLAGYTFYTNLGDNQYQVSSLFTSTEEMQDGMRSAFSELAKQYNIELNNLNNTIASTTNKNKANWSSVLSSISAWLATDPSYVALNDDVQAVIQTMVNNIDFGNIDGINTWEGMQTYIHDEIISKIEGADYEVQKAFSQLLRIKPENYQSTSDFISAIEEQAQDIVDKSEGLFTYDTILQNTGYKDIIDQYETTAQDIINVLDDELNGKELEKIKDNILSLSPSDLARASNIIRNYGIKTWEDLQEALENKTFDAVVDFDVEAEGLEKLQTALDETVSSAGLSAESIGNIKSRYQELDSYDPATLFEETANGIHLNIKAARELEDEYEDLNKKALDNKLDELVEQYNDLTVEIQNTSDAFKRAELYSQRQNIIDQINDTATLASRYEGLTSAYNKWQTALEGPEERDMYEGIIEGKKAVDEEISRGWIDESTREYLELMSGKDLSTSNYEQLLAVYKSLNNEIGSSGHTVYDFFTKDKDGNATADGVYNFFDTVKSAFNESVAWIDKNGKYHLDFANAIFGDETGDAAIAKALGISEELVQIILRAASEAGFNINLESAYTELANLKDEAVAANDKLKEIGATDYTFNINSTDVEDLDVQILKAKEALNKLANEDDTINVNTDGVKEAQELLSYLIYQKQTLDDALILRIDTTNAQSKVDIAIQTLKDFKAAYNNLEVKIAIGEDTTEAETELGNAIDKLQSISPTILTHLGIDVSQSYNEINSAINNITPEMLLAAGVDESVVNEFKEADHTTVGEVIWENNLKEVTDWINNPNDSKIAYGTIKWRNDTTTVETGGGVVNGTAHAHGTWGSSDTDTALVGELGQEMVVRGDRWFTVGNNGAEFTDIKKGDIVFNHKQTESLLKNGHVTGRGKMSGKAYASGTSKISELLKTPISQTISNIFNSLFKKEEKKAESNQKSNKSSTSTTHTTKEAKEESIKIKQLNTSSAAAAKQLNSGSTATGGSRATMQAAKSAGKQAAGSSSSTKDDSKQLIDFIEMKLENIEAIISKTTAKLTNYVDDTSAESNKLTQYNKLVSEEKNKQKVYDDAESYYTKKAEALLNKVDSKYRDMAKNGAIAIEDFVGDKEQKQAEAIQEYREMVTKANEAKVAELETIARIEEIRLEQFNDLADDYDNLISVIESESELIQAQMGLQELQGERLSATYYKALIENTNETISELEDKRARMQKDLNSAVKSGDIKKGSDAWYEMVNAIADVDEAIIQGSANIEEFQNAINDLKWDNLDKLISRFDALDSELSHIYDRLTDNDDVVDDAGNWNENGIAALGVAAQQMELAKTKADQYSDAINELTKDYKKGLYSEDEYNEKLAELKENQWDSIEAYEDAKDAIVDLNKTRIDAVKDGMEKEIDAYKELIDKKQEALDAEKDLYDFQKSVAEQQKDIADIDRKLAALANDNSASARAERARLEAERLEAQEALEETYYDRSVSQQKEALDKEYEQYEENMNAEMEALDEYLKNEEAVIIDSMNVVKANADTVLSEIKSISKQYGIEISSAIVSPWKDGENAIAGFFDQFTTITSAFTDQLQIIIDKEHELEVQANKTAKSVVNTTSKNVSNTQSATKSTSKQSSSSSSSSNKSSTSSTSKAIQKGQSVTVKKTATNFSAKSSNKKMASHVPGGSYTVMQVSGNQILIGKKGVATGWVKKTDLVGYKHGTLGVPNDQWAWIDEVGEELVMHAGADGKLSYLTKGSSVIPSDLTEKLMKLAVDPTQTLENSRPVISAPHITHNEINIDASIAEVIHIDTVTNDTLPNLEKVVSKQMDQYVKSLNANIRKYTR